MSIRKTRRKARRAKIKASNKLAKSNLKYFKKVDKLNRKDKDTGSMVRDKVMTKTTRRIKRRDKATIKGKPKKAARLQKRSDKKAGRVERRTTRKVGRINKRKAKSRASTKKMKRGGRALPKRGSRARTNRKTKSKRVSKYKKGGSAKKSSKDPRLKRAGVSGYNKPKRTPNHPKKSHIVVAKEGDKVKTIRFGQQGVKGSPKKKGESKSYAKRRKSFKARHGKNIKKGKLSAAYWADRVKW